MTVLPEFVADAADRIGPYIHYTPVLTHWKFDAMTEAQVYFKCENFQFTGSYKIRGASHAICMLSDEQRRKGVVTHSSGNFAQALALAAGKMNIPAYIIMPTDAPEIKRKGSLEYGAVLTTCQPGLKARQRAAEKVIEETAASFIHPSNDLNVIYGQGTAALELLGSQPGLEHIIAPVGGGGLLAGTILAAQHEAPSCNVWGAEPFEADDAYRSIHSGSIQTNTTTNTIADGLRTELGNHTFPIIQKGIKDIIRVTEEEIKTAMRWVWEQMKIIIEPSSAVAVAAVIREKERFKGQKIGILISGGNTNLDQPVFAS